MNELMQWLLPWQVSPLAQIVFWGAALCYIVGLVRRRREGRRDGFLRPLAFFVGLALMYAVMQTRLDYYAQYLFFAHRAQHLVLHHLGPFLVALAAPWPAIGRGMPWPLNRISRLPPVRLGYRALQQPAVAGLLFVGLIYFWLVPAVHFDAMISHRLYWVMNASMAIDGLLFWWLMLERGEPGATPRLPFGRRILVLALVMPPQIVLGAYITFSSSNLFDVYAVCGRAFPIAPLVDQQIGGLITWIPAAMMSVVGALVVLSFRLRGDLETDSRGDDSLEITA
ncbi:MAG: cytochrome c oxidase assembly protein [Ectothiorhodospiraceae bacterium]|jgi:putative membrane protein